MANSKIIEVPTLLDALDYICNMEINEQDSDEMHLRAPGYEMEGCFTLFQDETGVGHLYPVNLSHNMYFRGERTIYPHCYASIYRNSTEESIFLEHLKCCELSLLVEEWPLTKIFRNDLIFPSNIGAVHIPLSIDSEALAQHYGINTDLIDVTVDKWVAAFFACTYLDKDGNFKPVTDESQYGMINIYYSRSWNFPFDDPELRAIGLQPFSRPGEQAGYVVKMQPCEDFYDKCSTRIKFRHDARVSQLVFNYTNRANKLFPKSILEGKVETIKKSKTFSEAAYAKCKTLYYGDVDNSILKGYINTLKIDIIPTSTVKFTDGEKKKINDDLPNQLQKFVSKLVFPNLPRVTLLKN